MKILIKSTVAALIVATVVILGSLCAFAQTEGASTADLPYDTIEGVQESTDGSLTEDVDTTKDVNEGTEGENGKSSDTGTGIISELADQLRSNLPEILTTATLAVSVILAFLYKKGLLPLLTGALHRISANIGEFSKKTEERSEDTRLLTEALKGRLEAAELTVQRISETLEGITLLLNESKERQSTAQIVVTLFDAQLNLLLDLINSSNLPLTRKEELKAKFGYFLELIGGLKNEQTALQADN